MAITLESFMNALAGKESGGNYNARNEDSGASGKFQIMPANWPSWAAEAGLSPSAPQTPANQERVARYKILQYYKTFGNWEDVAAAWYSGSGRKPKTLDNPQGGGKYPTIRQYVDDVVARASGQAVNGIKLESGDVSDKPTSTYGSVALDYFKNKTAGLPAGSGRNIIDNGQPVYKLGGNWNIPVKGEGTYRFPGGSIDTKGNFIGPDGKPVSKDGTTLITKPNPLGHFLPPEIQAQGFDAQIDYLLEKYLNMLDDFPPNIEDLIQAANGLDPNVDPEDALAELQSYGPDIIQKYQQFVSVATALDKLQEMQQSGLITTGLDSAKAFVDSETGKSADAARAFQDYSSRVNMLTGLGEKAAQQTNRIYENFQGAQEFNQQIPSQIASGQLGWLTRPRLNDSSRAKQINYEPFMNTIAQTIPATAPSFYGVDPGVYDRLSEAINSRRGFRGSSGSSSTPPGAATTLSSVALGRYDQTNLTDERGI